MRNLELSAAPLQAFVWFTVGASMLGVATFSLVYFFVLGDVSQSADTVAAISGFAISVSGSVVAIVLAARSLQQQNDISNVERRAIEREEAREAERELRESIGSLREYLATNRSTFRAVEVAAERLACASDVPRAFGVSEEFTSQVAEAQGEAVRALGDLADSLAAWPEVKILADAVQEPRCSDISKRETDARRLVNRMSNVYSDFLSLSQTEALKNLRRRHAEREFEERTESQWFEEEIAEDELLEDETQGQDVRIDHDQHESKWFSLKSQRVCQGRRIQSGVERSDTNMSSALPECIELIREMAAELAGASTATLWRRRVQATFSTRVQSVAVLDPTEAGGYHMSADARRPIRTIARQRTDTSKNRLRPRRRERTPEAESKEKSLLETAEWVDDPTHHDRATPLNCFMIFSDPAGYFTTFEEAQRDNLAKGGALPRFPLLLNRGATIILRAVAELPSSFEIEAALDRKLTELPETAKRMIPTEDIDTFCITALPKLMNELIETPDKVFCPALDWVGHRRRFEMNGVDLAADVRVATERKVWPPYPQWPGSRPRRKSVNLNLR